MIVHRHFCFLESICVSLLDNDSGEMAGNEGERFWIWTKCNVVDSQHQSPNSWGLSDTVHLCTTVWEYGTLLLLSLLVCCVGQASFSLHNRPTKQNISHMGWEHLKYVWVYTHERPVEQGWNRMQRKNRQRVTVSYITLQYSVFCCTDYTFQRKTPSSPRVSVLECVLVMPHLWGTLLQFNNS